MGAVTFMILGLTADRQAEALPFVSQIHELPTPDRTTVFDQRIEGGYKFDEKRRCATRARVLVRSKQNLTALQNHYANHRIKSLDGTGEINALVKPINAIGNLRPEWEKLRTDPSVYVLDFVSPGTPGTEPYCSQ